MPVAAPIAVTHHRLLHDHNRRCTNWISSLRACASKDKKLVLICVTIYIINILHLINENYPLLHTTIKASTLDKFATFLFSYTWGFVYRIAGHCCISRLEYILQILHIFCCVCVLWVHKLCQCIDVFSVHIICPVDSLNICLISGKLYIYIYIYINANIFIGDTYPLTCFLYSMLNWIGGTTWSYTRQHYWSWFSYL